MTAYTLFSQTGGGSLISDMNNYTFGMEFTLSENCPLTGIWWYSPSGVSELPQICGIMLVSDGSIVTENIAATWSGAAGSGWVKCSFDGSVTLTASTGYAACVKTANTDFGNWYSATSHYWDTGPGSGGLTNGPITGLANSAVTGMMTGQDGYTTSTSSPDLEFPSSTFGATNYWVDVEVTAGAPPPPPNVPGALYSMRSLP